MWQQMSCHCRHHVQRFCFYALRHINCLTKPSDFVFKSFVYNKKGDQRNSILIFTKLWNDSVVLDIEWHCCTGHRLTVLHLTYGSRNNQWQPEPPLNIAVRKSTYVHRILKFNPGLFCYVKGQKVSSYSCFLTQMFALNRTVFSNVLLIDVGEMRKHTKFSVAIACFAIQLVTSAVLSLLADPRPDM